MYRYCWLIAILITCMNAHFACADDSKSAAKEKSAAPKKKTLAERQAFAANIVIAFRETHDGWSSDEVLLQDKLNQAFLKKCRELVPESNAAECNWTLINLRKAGKLSGIRSTRRRYDRHDDYLHAAEIAARLMYDKYEVSTDRMLCDPKRRAEFDSVASKAAPKVDAYLLRKASFGLRKSRRLQPELVLRVADWKKEILTFPAEKLVKDEKLIPDVPGIYIFRDETGYLYIGESSRLRSRVSKHLDHSDRKSLAHYLWKNGVKKITVELHAFDAESRAKVKNVRRAYESELIRSRKPRFNIAP
ncbi:MAG: excinuclease ABC subunit C [Planctomycetaceae bacterium]|nr:excinuclease ABC subunit C [Planctomycetaceae bacterium]